MENPPPVIPQQSPIVQPQKLSQEPPIFKPPDEPKPKNKLIPLLVFLLLIALGMAGRFGWQNYQMRLEKEVVDVEPEASSVVEVDETEGWKTYEGFKDKLTFKYPDQLIEPCDPLFPEDETVSFYEAPLICEPGSYGQSYMDVYVYNLREFSIETLGKPFNTRTTMVNGREITIDEGFTSDENTIITRTALGNDFWFEISFRTDEVLNEKLVNQIISTFKFIDVTRGWDPNDVVEVVDDSVKKRICPDEWIVNMMPGSVTPSPAPQEYLIINAKREEIINYDLNWIKSNCSIKEPQVVY